jgi:hypothetical protein
MILCQACGRQAPVSELEQLWLEPSGQPSCALGRATQLQVMPNSDEDDVLGEALSRNEARRLGRPMAATAKAGPIRNSTTLHRCRRECDRKRSSGDHERIVTTFGGRLTPRRRRTTVLRGRSRFTGPSTCYRPTSGPVARDRRLLSGRSQVQLARTSMRRGCSFGARGKRSVRTPCFSSA